VWLGPGFGQQHWQYLVMDRKTSFGSFIYSHSSTNPANLVRTGLVDVEVTGLTDTHTHTHTHPFNGPLSETTQVSQYQKGKTNLDFTEARDSEWQWHQLGHMQFCTSLQTDNHVSTPPLSFLQAGCPSCCPTNNVKALKALVTGLTEVKNFFK